jgi:sensor histidine kinase YesM
MGTCIRCQGEYDGQTKLCTRCKADNTGYAEHIAQGLSGNRAARLFVAFLPLTILLAAWIMIVVVGFPVSIKMVMVLSIIGLVIWFLVTLPMLFLSYSARITFWEHAYLRGLDFLAKRPPGVVSLIVGTLLIAVLLTLALGVIFISYMLSPQALGREYTVVTITLALFFSLAIAAFCYSMIIAVEVRRLMPLLPPPIFTDSQALQDLAFESVRESLGLDKRETSIAEVKRTDDAGIEMIVVWTTEEFVEDKKSGERKKETKTKRFQVKADKWGRVTSFEEKKKD